MQRAFSTPGLRHVPAARNGNDERTTWEGKLLVIKKAVAEPNERERLGSQEYLGLRPLWGLHLLLAPLGGPSSGHALWAWFVTVTTEAMEDAVAAYMLAVCRSNPDSLVLPKVEHSVSAERRFEPALPAASRWLSGRNVTLERIYPLDLQQTRSGG